jgi:plastocyanin
MKRHHSIAIVAALIVGGLACGDSTGYGGGGGGGGNPPTGDVLITVGAMGKTTTAYAPNPFVVALNGGASVNVKFANVDALTHTVTQDGASPTFNHSFAKFATFTITFTTAGTYNYHCDIHHNMVGTITVNP